MSPTSITDNDTKKYIQINFGIVPVGSIHKKSVDITNELQVSTLNCFQRTFTIGI